MTAFRTFAVAALLALAACGQQAPSGEGAQKQNEGPVILGSTRDMPDWLLVARQRDCVGNEDPGESCPLGEIHFNQRTITRAADGFADIWIQVRHANTQTYAYETETSETAIRYELERLHYRFNCNSGEFMVVERQFMGPRESVVARDEPLPVYRAPVQGSVTSVIQPIACRGS